MAKLTYSEFGPDDPIFREGPSIFSVPPRPRRGPPPRQGEEPPRAPPMSPEDMAQQYELQRKLEESLPRKDEEK